MERMMLNLNGLHIENVFEQIENKMTLAVALEKYGINECFATNELFVENTVICDKQAKRI